MDDVMNDDSVSTLVVIEAKQHIQTVSAEVEAEEKNKKKADAGSSPV